MWHAGPRIGSWQLPARKFEQILSTHEYGGRQHVPHIDHGVAMIAVVGQAKSSHDMVHVAHGSDWFVSRLMNGLIQFMTA